MHSCRRCGLALPADTVSGLCQACLAHPPAIAQLDFIANYDGLLADWIVAAKIGRQAAAIGALRQVLRQRAGLSPPPLYKGAALLPMPIPKPRLMSRGFNLPRLLAQQLSRQWGLPVVPSHVVTRAWSGKKQAKLTRQQRQAQQHRYQINDSLPANIVVVDDVMTTGQTLNELAKSLQKEKVKNISAWVLARAQKDKKPVIRP
ncbi:MAG: hypothetical protein CR957_00245 [Gammaproteobacteria bacterium]|nr:MAG: hypothetical protein CR957_00245 [Gammaproteobacteria bacterium]